LITNHSWDFGRLEFLYSKKFAFGIIASEPNYDFWDAEEEGLYPELVQLPLELDNFIVGAYFGGGLEFDPICAAGPIC